MQEHVEGNKVIAYASRSTTKTEQNYSIYDLEALGLDFALNKWRNYLLGTKYIVYTDNIVLISKNLVSIGSN